ncbi:hypothetical protein IPM09_03525 [Candidatus Saccharibacteria bacterium]|nr:MAG: hypothetical protein IPM09_03525 [Candidatus Saccharibacteria bacterium]
MSESGRKFEMFPGRDPERRFGAGEREPTVDLRSEYEVFTDHERVDNARDNDDALARLRDTLSEDSDGIIHLVIPEYNYDFSTNPFVGMGPATRRTYAISRYLDVVFLHRFMYQDILVCGVRSRDFVDEPERAAWVRHISQTGGIRLDESDTSYDILALKFAPYVASDTTAAWMLLYHKQEPHSTQRPHYPLDVWMIYDANAYKEIEGVGDFRRAYTLREGYDRRASLIGIAQIN